MKKIVRLQESDIKKLIKNILSEQENERYMFFSNLEQLHRQTAILLELGEDVVLNILENGHDWAQDHVAVAKENIDQVFDFFKNEFEKEEEYVDYEDVMSEGRKKTGTKLCARGVASAKAKYDVYPSAYSNGHAVQVCKGKIKGLDGKKHCSGAYC